MEASAKLTFARISPRKTRLLVDMIRGRQIQSALNILKYSPQPSAKLISNLIKSAAANAEQKGVADIDQLYVKTIYVNAGTVLKRFLPRAMGRASRIRKPTSNVHVVLAEKK